MKIVIEGTESEIEKAKLTIESACFFSSEFCDLKLDCEDCEKKQGLEISYIVKS